MSTSSTTSQQVAATSNITPPPRPVPKPLVFNDAAMTSPFGSGAWSLYGTRVDGVKSTHQIVTVPDAIGLTYATCIIQHLLKGGDTTKDQTITWLLSAFSALYPDEGLKIQATTARFVRTPIDETLLTYLKGEEMVESTEMETVDDGTGGTVRRHKQVPNVDQRWSMEWNIIMMLTPFMI